MIQAVRLVTYDDGSGRSSGILIGEQVVPTANVGAPARSVRGLLDALDAAGLAALGQRADAWRGDESAPGRVSV
jgi:hypothetical protein